MPPGRRFPTPLTLHPDLLEPLLSSSLPSLPPQLLLLPPLPAGAGASLVAMVLSSDIWGIGTTGGEKGRKRRIKRLMGRERKKSRGCGPAGHTRIFFCAWWIVISQSFPAADYSEPSLGSNCSIKEIHIATPLLLPTTPYPPTTLNLTPSHRRALQSSNRRPINILSAPS